MTDPRRLWETEGTDAEVAFLLRAAKLQVPPSLGKGRVLAGLGLVAGATTFASTGTAGAVAAGSAAVAGKWIAIAAVGAALAVGGVEVSRAVAPRGVSGAVAAAHAVGASGSLPTPHRAPSYGGSTPTGAPLNASIPPAAPPATAPTMATPASAAPVASAISVAAPRMSEAPRSSVNPPLSSTPESAVSAELADIDRARRALARGEPAAAVAFLDAHDRRFGHPYFAQEATVLRVEALVALADADGARRVGEDLLLREPASPYAQRIRSLLRGSAAPTNP